MSDVVWQKQDDFPTQTNQLNQINPSLLDCSSCLKMYEQNIKIANSTRTNEDKRRKKIKLRRITDIPMPTFELSLNLPQSKPTEINSGHHFHPIA